MRNNVFQLAITVHAYPIIFFCMDASSALFEAVH